MFNSRRFQIALLTVLCCVVGAVAGAPGASAGVQRYASAGGAGNDCSAVKPCPVDVAINGAPSGAEVIVQPGDYAVTSPIHTTQPVVIHGVAGQGRPTLHLSAGSHLDLENSALSYVEVVQESPTLAALSAYSSKLDQVVARGGMTAICAAVVNNTAVRNSILVSRNPTGDSVCAPTFGGLNSSVLLNVTAITRGTGAAVNAFVANPAGSVEVQALNVIASAGPGGSGFKADAATGGHATITVAHSNYHSYSSYGLGGQLVGAGGNQIELPAFVDEASGDYRQRPGSVTIDAGKNESKIGAFDVDGDPRAVGQTDIGADEFVPAQAGGGQTPPPSPGGSTGGSPAAGGFAGVKLVSTALTLKRGYVRLKLSCPVATAGRCTGITKLSARRKRAGSPRASTVSLGRARFSIAAGDTARLKVRASRAGRRLFAHRRRLRGRATSVAHDVSGLARTTSTRVTIRKAAR